MIIKKIVFLTKLIVLHFSIMFSFSTKASHSSNYYNKIFKTCKKYCISFIRRKYLNEFYLNTLKTQGIVHAYNAEISEMCMGH